MTYSIIHTPDGWTIVNGAHPIEMFNPDGLAEAGARLRELEAKAEAADDHRRAFEQRLAAVETKVKLAAEQAAVLPDYFDVPCGCGADALRLIEPGYERWSHVEIVAREDDNMNEIDPYFHATSDGWDDMGEHGAFEYLTCSPVNGGCGAVWRAPDNMDWD